jgi:hypothetical protein
MIKQIAILSTFCILGCASERQFHKAEAKLSQGGRLAKICADRFPSRDSIVYRDSVRIDTAYEGEYIFDTIRTLDTIYITKTVPVTKTIIKTKTIVKENTAKVEAAQLALEACNNDFAEMSLGMLEERKELDRMKRLARERLVILWIVVILSVLWTLRKFIFRYAN